MTGINRNSIRSASRKGFTLVEILIVVIILGILAAIVIPQFTNASTDARKSNMASQDQTIKSQISLYMLQHNDTAPTAAQGLFTQLTTVTDVNGNAANAGAVGALGPYLQATPVNPLAPAADNTAVDVSLNGPISAGTIATGYAWVYVPATGEFHGVNQSGFTSDDGN
jgi:general secretion pathway protein G